MKRNHQTVIYLVAVSLILLYPIFRVDKLALVVKGATVPGCKICHLQAEYTLQLATIDSFMKRLLINRQ
jgi:hypothetical protein